MAAVTASTTATGLSRVCFWRSEYPRLNPIKKSIAFTKLVIHTPIWFSPKRVKNPIRARDPQKDGKDDSSSFISQVLSLSLSHLYFWPNREIFWPEQIPIIFFFSFHFCNYHCLVHSPPYWVFAIISLKRVLDWIGLFMPNPNEGNKKKKL